MEISEAYVPCTCVARTTLRLDVGKGNASPCSQCWLAPSLAPNERIYEHKSCGKPFGTPIIANWSLQTMCSRAWALISVMYRYLHNARTCSHVTSAWRACLTQKHLKRVNVSVAVLMVRRDFVQPTSPHRCALSHIRRFCSTGNKQRVTSLQF